MARYAVVLERFSWIARREHEHDEAGVMGYSVTFVFDGDRAIFTVFLDSHL